MSHIDELRVTVKTMLADPNITEHEHSQLTEIASVLGEDIKQDVKKEDK